ncbi:MAG: hypothetical protein IJE81_06275 [Oscillospiraceae bacterium]|nr:hypothetical protein [Oscillospiraceae bacterium]
MRCPLCNSEMQEGGLVIDGVAPGWVPLEQFQKRGLHRLVHTGLRTIGKTSILLRQTKVSNAFFCARCNKIIGVFDVTNALEV